MKKALFILTLFIITAVLLVSCGNNTNTPSVGGEETQPPETEAPKVYNFGDTTIQALKGKSFYKIFEAPEGDPRQAVVDYMRKMATVEWVAGKTWTTSITNIGDVQISTPSLIYDQKTGLVSNYYYQRGRGMLKRRVAKVDEILGNPLVWRKPEIIAFASAVGYDAGNVNATFIGDTHYLAYYSGDRKKASVVISSTPAPQK